MRAARLWHAGILLVVLCSLVIRVVVILAASTGSAENDPTTVTLVRLGKLVSYYTIQSNIVVAIVCVLLILNPLRAGPGWEVLRLNSLLSITITGLVYALVLAPNVHPVGWPLVAAIGFHFVVPPATIAGWLLFGPRPRFAWSTLVAALLIALAWLVFIFAQGTLTDWYPYAFLDIAEGALRAYFNAAALVLVAIGCLLLYRMLDRKVPSAWAGR